MEEETLVFRGNVKLSGENLGGIPPKEAPDAPLITVALFFHQDAAERTEPHRPSIMTKDAKTFNVSIIAPMLLNNSE